MATREALKGLQVDLRLWQPRNAAGDVIHGQVEAYVDFIRRERDTTDWAAFIDADEYLDHGGALTWDQVLDAMHAVDCHRGVLQGHVYESRWTRDGRPREMGSLRCAGLQSEDGLTLGAKSLARIAKVMAADIHWGWRTADGNAAHVLDPLQFYFRHYKADDLSLKVLAKPRARPSADEDQSIAI